MERSIRSRNEKQILFSLRALTVQSKSYKQPYLYNGNV